MTVEQLYEYRVRDLPTRLFYWIILTFVIAFVFVGNYHACWRSLIPYDATQDRAIMLCIRKYLCEKAANTANLI